MEFTLGKMPWYAQVGAFVVLSLAGAGAFWNFYAKPARASIDARSAQLATLREEIRKGEIYKRRLPEVRRQIADLEQQLERLRAVLPEEKDVADLLRRIQGMATQSNLAIRGFTPRAVATKQLHAEWPIGLELEGSYHDLGAFLERVSKFPRIINVNGIKIRGAEQARAGATISAECTATTFVLIEPKAAPAAKPGAPATKATAPRGN